MQFIRFNFSERALSYSISIDSKIFLLTASFHICCPSGELSDISFIKDSISSFEQIPDKAFKTRSFVTASCGSIECCEFNQFCRSFVFVLIFFINSFIWAEFSPVKYIDCACAPSCLTSCCTFLICALIFSISGFCFSISSICFWISLYSDVFGFNVFNFSTRTLYSGISFLNNSKLSFKPDNSSSFSAFFACISLIFARFSFPTI